MADSKTSALTALAGTASDAADLIPIVDTSATTTKKMVLSELGVAVPLWEALTINAQVDTYGVVLADAGKLVTCNKATAFTVTLPANGTIPIPVGTCIHFLQLGVGQITIAITSDTLNGTPGLKLRTQYSMATAIKIASSTWVLVGDISA